MAQISKYQLQGKIGAGVYGDVYKAINTQTGQIVAVKKIKKQSQEQGVSVVALRETSILQTVQHDNIVKLIEIEHVQGCIRVVMEYYEKDLDSFMKQQKKLDQEQIKNFKSFLQGILNGMKECHQKKCMHRDLKPQNILISKEGKIKIGDFGMARSFQKVPGPYTQEVITLWYRPPELLLQSNNYSTSIDVWSIGCIFGQMVLGVPLFAGDSEIMQMKLICEDISIRQQNSDILANEQLQIQFENKLETKFQNTDIGIDGLDLLKKLLILDPNTRISCEEALNHIYFGVEQEKVKNLDILLEYFREII